MSRLAVFGYGSLVSPESAAQSLGRPVELAALARLRGHRRRWSTVRDNRAVEKTFALRDGWIPAHVVGLNLERDTACAAPNGALIEITPAEADRLDLREMRYERTDVTAEIQTSGAPAGHLDFDQVIAYVAKPAHFAPEPPPGAIVIASYVRAVESAFAALGQDQLTLYRETTDPPPVEAVEATLVRDAIPAGNPRAW